MIPSLFSLDHRLSELRPSDAELHLARERAEATERRSLPERSAGETVRRLLVGDQAKAGPPHLAVR